MLISELPPGLKELAEKRRAECTKKGFYKRATRLVKSFHWDGTPEGFDFWNLVDSYNFSPYYGCRITNVKLKNKDEQTSN